MPEQKERLEAFCKFKGYEIIDYYQDAGISAKTGNLRPEFERLKEDIKAKKINTIIALKLDRITRSIYDWENLMTFLDENEALELIVDKAIERNTGARGLRSIIEDIMRDIMFDIPSNPNIEKCIITKDTVKDKAAPKIVINEERQDKEKTIKKKKIIADNKETA